MYRKIEDFEKDWKYESGATLKVLKNLRDDTLDQRVTPEGRSLGFLAWHLVLTLGEMLGRTGLTTEAPDESAAVPRSAAMIVKAYEQAAHSVQEQVRKNWDDASLLEEVDMYGEMWKRGFALSSFIHHQTHHRGQMTVLMRQAGLLVPGVYGPSKEEWAQMGMTPHK